MTICAGLDATLLGGAIEGALSPILDATLAATRGSIVVVLAAANAAGMAEVASTRDSVSPALDWWSTRALTIVVVCV